EVAEVNTSWLPMHHDMGLIGCLTFPITYGLDITLMNPTTFLARPIRYLEALSGKASIMSGPNFGYQFCVDRLTQKDVAGLDLSKIVAATSGSEMIRPETMNAFCDLMAPSGFKREMLMPCYGMAEATLAVTFFSDNAGLGTKAVPQKSGFVLEEQEVVNVGICVPDTEVKIVDAAERTLDQDELGHIYVKGPAVFSGYFNDEDETAASMESEWLKTGDLGFISGDDLYIAGRSKEILVIRGENIMPHEVEWLAEEARGQGTGGERTAAFSISQEGAGEEISLVVETNEKDDGKLSELDRAIKSRIGRAMSLPVADLVFVKRGSIPRTTSGKIQRSKIKQQYLDGTLTRIEWTAVSG
ncbi:MAG: AMP-binding protein, partial [Verrucomicrobiota bacterium]